MADDRKETAEERQEREWQEEDDAFRAQWDRAWKKEEAEREAKRNPNGKNSDYGANSPAGEPLISPTVVDARSWHGTQRPTRVFLDDRKWFRMGMVSNFSGPGGIGKTMAALQACVACASGTQWLGRDIMAGPAMFYSAEEPIDEIHTRVDEYCEAENLHLNQFPHALEIIDTSWHPNAALIEVTMGRSGLLITLSPMFHWLRAKMLIAKPKVLFIDNRAQVVIGNENDRNVAGFAMRSFATLAKDTGAAVVPLSHPSMAGSKTGSSGSTQWFNTARSNVFMTRPGQEDDDNDIADLKGDEGKRVLKNNKSNYGPLDSEANVVWEFNRWKCTDPPVRVDDSVGKHDKAERVFLKLLRLLVSQNMGDHLSPFSRSGHSYAPNVFAAHPDREGLSPKWFKMAMQNLLHRKVIEVAERGPPSKRIKFLREVTRG